MSSEGMPTVRLDSSRPAWEYALVVATGGGLFGDINVSEIHDTFNRYGADGWELVSVVHVQRSGPTQLLATFKRPRD